MPMRNYPRYSGGSGLADLLSGLADGYKMGSALKSQRDADKLARDREARYVAEQAAAQKQRELENERNRLSDAAAGRFASTDGLDLGEQVTTRDNSDARSVLGATRALGALPGMDVSSLAPLIKNTTENRYQATGGGALDRVRTDPVLQTKMRDEATRQTGLQQNVKDFDAARALEQIAPGSGAAVRAGASPDASLRFANEAAQRERDEALRAAQLASLQQQYRAKTKMDPTGLTLEDLQTAVGRADGLADYTARKKVDANFRERSYEFVRDPETGAVTAYDRSNPNRTVAVQQGTKFNPKDELLGFQPDSYRESTIAERQAVSRGNRAAEAMRVLQSMPMPSGLNAVIARSRGGGAESVRSAIETWAKNNMADANGQRFAYNLLRAGEPALRDASGAQINEDELPRILMLIGAWPGATREVRADAYRSQDDILQGFAINGARAITDPSAGNLRREVRAILDPTQYVVRRRNQLILSGYPEAEASKMALEETKSRYPKQEP